MKDITFESDLLKELEALAAEAGAETVDEVIEEDEVSEAGEGIAVPIRMADEGVNDFGVEHVELTEEDVNDPDLLAELAQMNSNNAVSEPKDVEDKEAMEKEDTVMEKEAAGEETAANVEKEDTAGNTDKADAVLAKPLEQPKDLGGMSVEELKQLIEQHKVQAVMCKRAGDQSGMQQSFQIYKAAQAKLAELDASGNSQSLRMAAQEAMKVLEKQLKTAKQAQKRNWEQALEADLVALKALALKNAQGTLPMVKQSVSVPILQTQPHIPRGEMHVCIGALHPKREGTAIPAELGKQDHFYRISLDAPVNSATTFRAREWKDLKDSRFILGIADKTSKFFEHHRLKVELLRKEPVMLFLKHKEVCVGSGSIKLAPLLMQASLHQELELAAGLIASVRIDLREPLKGASASQQREESWLLPQKGQAIRLFVKPEKYASYVVIEWEIEQCKGDAKKQAALQAQGAALQKAVENGTLSLPQYLDQVREAIAQCKKGALEAKRAGKLDECRRLLKHLQLMEDEVSEATAE